MSPRRLFFPGSSQFFLTHTHTHIWKKFFQFFLTKKKNGYNFLSEIIWYFIIRNSIHVAKFSSFSGNCNGNFFFFFLFLFFFLTFFPDAPVCITDKIVIVGAYRSENLNVVCEVHADPPPRSFKWKFNSSGESYEIAKDRYFKNGSQSSVLHYTPVMDQDYGTLTCSGQNDVGEQSNPCVFQVILAGKDTATFFHNTKCL